MKFALQHTDARSQARAGRITLERGTIDTPVFMPVGTVASVKAVSQQLLSENLNAPIILSNTYHLYLRPGMDTLRAARGLHNFMQWSRPILTDSGGYQVYSLSARRRITEEGVSFSSHVDGSPMFFSPESVIDTQRVIGSDIVMAFDECTPHPCSYSYAKHSMQRTHRWLDRCISRFQHTPSLWGYEQTLFPIVQGSIYRDLRLASAAYVAQANQPGCAIGGVCHPDGMLCEVVSWVCDVLPKHKPRYLMGVGTPLDLLNCIALGIDMFDCVMPTRNGRNGMLFTTEGIIHIRNAQWKNDFTPVDARVGTDCSKAYLHHLMRSKELLGAQIASAHNLRFYLWLVREARAHILSGDFDTWRASLTPVLSYKL